MAEYRPVSSEPFHPTVDGAPCSPFAPLTLFARPRYSHSF